MSARHRRQRRVKAPVFEVAAEFDEGGHRQIGPPVPWATCRTARTGRRTPWPSAVAVTGSTAAAVSALVLYAHRARATGTAAGRTPFRRGLAGRPSPGEWGVGQPEQARRLVVRLVPDGRPADGHRDRAADQGRPGRVAGVDNGGWAVAGPPRAGDRRAGADDIDQVAGSQPRKRTWICREEAGASTTRCGDRSCRRASTRNRAVGLDDRPGHAAWAGPDTLGVPPGRRGGVSVGT